MPIHKENNGIITRVDLIRMGLKNQWVFKKLKDECIKNSYRR